MSYASYLEQQAEEIGASVGRDSAVNGVKTMTYFELANMARDQYNQYCINGMRDDCPRKNFVRAFKQGFYTTYSIWRKR